jgi:uncharacterized protein DUF4389
MKERIGAFASACMPNSMLSRVNDVILHARRNPLNDSDLSHPRLKYDVPYPGELSRWLIFVKWLLVIPHLIVLAFLGLAMAVTTFIAWFAILITGNYPEGLWSFAKMVLIWQARVSAYTGLMRDEYPPFSTSEPYPLTFDLDYPQSLSRMMIFIKWLLVIPHLIALYFLGMVASFITFIAFFAILFTKRYPESLFNFSVGYQRWSYRVQTYYMLMTDDYPPFTLNDELMGPTGPALPASPTLPAIGESRF